MSNTNEMKVVSFRKQKHLQVVKTSQFLDVLDINRFKVFQNTLQEFQ